MNSKIEVLKEKLDAAVDIQDYETAAKLRDEIKALEQEENGNE